MDLFIGALGVQCSWSRTLWECITPIVIFTPALLGGVSPILAIDSLLILISEVVGHPQVQFLLPRLPWPG